MITLILSIFVFLTYATILTSRSIPKSFSDTWYTKKYKPYFVLTFGSVALLVFASLQTFFTLGAASLLILCVSAPYFKQDKIAGAVHYIGATGAIVFGFVQLVYFNLWFIISAVIMIAFILIAKKYIKHYIFWIEYVAFMIIHFGLFIIILN